MAADADEAEAAAADIGFPVVLKADAESIVHKSDMGGVAVNLADAAALRAAAARDAASCSTPRTCASSFRSSCPAAWS